jgi:hypothetical protein
MLLLLLLTWNLIYFAQNNGSYSSPTIERKTSSKQAREHVRTENWMLLYDYLQCFSSKHTPRHPCHTATATTSAPSPPVICAS